MVVGERQNSQLEIVINIQNVFSESEGGYLRRQFSPGAFPAAALRPQEMAYSPHTKMGAYKTCKMWPGSAAIASAVQNSRTTGGI